MMMKMSIHVILSMEQLQHVMLIGLEQAVEKIALDLMYILLGKAQFLKTVSLVEAILQHVRRMILTPRREC
tara:strand:- start:88 stop:300 length:213 start_codon:yes stop_codon:yes gene_type:complete